MTKDERVYRENAKHVRRLGEIGRFWRVALAELVAVKPPNRLR